MNGRFEWVEFYEEFAKKLLLYKNKREDLVRIVKEVYTETAIPMPTLEKDNQLFDIDPFTVFGLFNKSSMRDDKRIMIIRCFAEKLKVRNTLPSAFDSIPVLNNQNATYYYWMDRRGVDDINHLWAFFESALVYAKEQSLENRKQVSKYFDIVINMKGNANSKTTMGLYWIAPDIFLNLDSRNEWYIYRSGRIPDDVIASLPELKSKITAEVYFELLEKMKAFLRSDRSALKDFKELSFEAWNFSKQVNLEVKQEKKAEGQRNDKGTALADEDVDTVHYWIYSAGDKSAKWDEFYRNGVMAIGWGEIGDLKNFETREAMRQKMKEIYGGTASYRSSAYATWQFSNEMKPGDVIFVKRGRHQLIGRGVVTSDYMYDEEAEEYSNIRNVNWTDCGTWEHPGEAVGKPLTDVTSYTEYVIKLNALFEKDDEEDPEEEEESYPIYTEKDFLFGKEDGKDRVYMSEADYDTLVGLVRTKKNVILQGAPGVGKTFAAKRLAYAMMGCKNPNRVSLVQFHQSYSYEDFIEGFRPSASGGFDIKKGSFYNFCKKAQEDQENEYFFIIDEINRGNLSKIFGELFMLIESDKRGNELQLLYSDEKFMVPKNVYLIGMMNTADRSLAMLDYALRRRFAFFDMKPGFESEGFLQYRKKLANEKFDRLIDAVEQLNEAIGTDETLGEGFYIGHSYFCNMEEVSDKKLSNIVEYELIPLIKEYWFDEPIKVKNWSYALRSAIK